MLYYYNKILIVCEASIMAKDHKEFPSDSLALKEIADAMLDSYPKTGKEKHKAKLEALVKSGEATPLICDMKAVNQFVQRIEKLYGDWESKSSGLIFSTKHSVHLLNSKPGSHHAARIYAIFLEKAYEVGLVDHKKYEKEISHVSHNKKDGTKQYPLLETVVAKLPALKKLIDVKVQVIPMKSDIKSATATPGAAGADTGGISKSLSKTAGSVAVMPSHKHAAEINVSDQKSEITVDDLIKQAKEAGNNCFDDHFVNLLDKLKKLDPGQFEQEDKNRHQTLLKTTQSVMSECMKNPHQYDPYRLLHNSISHSQYSRGKFSLAIKNLLKEIDPPNDDPNFTHRIR